MNFEKNGEKMVVFVQNTAIFCKICIMT
jgi:hypothetical protein